MKKKYIDTERLLAEIEKRLKNVRDYMSGTGMRYKGPKYFKAQGKESAYDALLSIVNSLQQEQPEAVEGEVCGRVFDHINVRFADGICKFLEPKNISHIPADVSKYKVGDKVRIIIVKEDEK